MNARCYWWLQLQFSELQLQSDLAEMLTIAGDFAVTIQVLNRQTGKTGDGDSSVVRAPDS